MILHPVVCYFRCLHSYVQLLIIPVSFLQVWNSARIGSTRYQQQQQLNLYLYADDAKVYKTIKNSEDNKTLQAVVNKIKYWSDK